MPFEETILIVNEDPLVIETINRILESDGYKTKTSKNVEEAIARLDVEDIGLCIIDMKLSKMDGIDFMRYLKKNRYDFDCIVISSYDDFETAHKLLEEGAYDFITHPFHAYDILMAVRRAVEKRQFIIQTRYYQRSMDQQVKERTTAAKIRTQEKHQLLINTIKSLVQTLEAKDKYTEGHSRRVADDAASVAQLIGLLPKDQEEVHLAGLLHDLGKIGIQEAILNKQGLLTEDEYEKIKEHPLISERILDPIPQLKSVATMIRHHHEFYDGSGYPDRLAGVAIPIGARILTICDAYDAMTSDRPYRKPLTKSRAFEIMRRNMGIQFDPEIAPVFMSTKQSGN